MCKRQSTCHKCGMALPKHSMPDRCLFCGEILKENTSGNAQTIDKKPPLWVRLLQRLSKPQDIGLGATVKRIASAVGGERFKAWSKRIGLPCGCTDREIEWNRLYPNPNYKE